MALRHQRESIRYHCSIHDHCCMHGFISTRAAISGCVSPVRVRGADKRPDARNEVQKIVCCKSMKRVQEQEHHLALANRQIAELMVQIVHQRVIVKHTLDTGQRSEMAESLLDALEGSLRIFEKHRIFLLSCSVNRPSKGDHPSAPTRQRLPNSLDL
jgi:hypothetical protein